MLMTWTPILIKTTLAWLLMVIAKTNKYQMLIRDIKNAYLYADCDINICIWVGPEFKLALFKELKME